MQHVRKRRPTRKTHGAAPKKERSLYAPLRAAPRRAGEDFAFYAYLYEGFRKMRRVHDTRDGGYATITRETRNAPRGAALSPRVHDDALENMQLAMQKMLCARNDDDG
ncbi:hypothetical protein JCM10599A_06420 [Paraburkholderia kururiensis]